MERPNYAAAAPGAPAGAQPAAIQVKPQAGAPVSTLLSNQVQEVYAVLSRNHPQEARDLHPGTVKTEQDATQFVGEAMAVIHPEAVQAETKATP